MADQQQKNEMIAEAIDQLNKSFTDYAWFSTKLSLGIILAIAIYLVWDIIRWYRLDRRLKKIEHDIERHDMKLWPDYYTEKDRKEAEENLKKSY